MWTLIKRKISFWQHPAPSKTELILDRRRIYTLPNKTGFVYAALLLTIFISSINYSLSLGYALNFILVSSGWLGINFTYRNLSGLGLSASPSNSVFAGELAHFNIHVANYTKRFRYAIQIGFTNSAMQFFDVAPNSNHNLSLASKALQRGWMTCPRIRIETTFPFGLLTAWSYWQTAQQILIYPSPEKHPPPLPYASDGGSGIEHIAGQEEFSGVRNYQAGDSLKQLAWRQMARQSSDDNQVLLSKNFEGGERQVCVLDFAALPNHLGVEEKLSRLCAWIIKAEQDQVRYSLKIEHTHLAQNSGDDHQQACLKTLALYGLSNLQNTPLGAHQS
ncbi:DUF58 domain-containing protein [Sapientia aquatica]|uniref:DUF58 domain-containing protein n=1 Tax=Sapientia aquatica TaxID=1549640 RepID=A0A4R5W5T6_9BURK|nr:DUF58 domain-containing protein [Sapientia aquatica]TDK68133.1 DUF58 domain-containing protein [Sapientia aquatica]